MPASRRVIESSLSPYRSAVLDAAVERQQRRESADAPPPPAAPPPPIVAPPRRRNREAHVETATASPDAALRASALQRLVERLATDGNFARKVSKDARRALEGEHYLNDDEKRALATLDAGRMARLAETTRRYKAIAAANERGQFAPAPLQRPSDYFGRFDDPRRAGPGGQGPSDVLGSSYFPRRGNAMDPKSPWGTSGGSGGGDEWGDWMGGGFGSGRRRGRGNAMDPKSPWGEAAGGAGKGGQADNPFQRPDLRGRRTGPHGEVYGGSSDGSPQIGRSDSPLFLST